jgi:hypothetical protein
VESLALTDLVEYLVEDSFDARTAGQCLADAYLFPQHFNFVAKLRSPSNTWQNLTFNDLTLNCRKPELVRKLRLYDRDRAVQ